MKFVLFLALGASRVLVESFPSREAKKRHKSDGTTENRYFLPQNRTITVERCDRIVDEAGLATRRGRKANECGRLCYECMQSKVR